jgi:hypothetical protein
MTNGTIVLQNFFIVEILSKIETAINLSLFPDDQGTSQQVVTNLLPHGRTRNDCTRFFGSNGSFLFKAVFL